MSDGKKEGKDESPDSGIKKSPEKTEKEKDKKWPAWMAYLGHKKPEKPEEEKPEKPEEEIEQTDPEPLALEYLPEYGPETAPYQTRSNAQD